MNHQHTIEQLRELRLTGMAEAFAHQMTDSVFASLAFEQRLHMMIEAERAQRDNQRYQRILKNAKLKVLATPEDIDYRSGRGLDKSVMADLLNCSWVVAHRNVLITGATGTGKTWIGCALGVQAARQGLTVAYRRTARLLEEMAIGHEDGTIARQREQAVADVAREAATASEPSTLALEPVVASSRPPEVSIRPPSWSTSSSASLSARFRATLATPTTPEAQEAFVRVLKIVHAIERALSALVALTRKLRDLVEHKDRRMAAKLDVTYQLDEARARRASADQKAKRWERDHPLRAAAAKAFASGEGGKPSAWQALIDEVQARHRHVQSLKATIRTHQASLDVFAEQEADLEGKQVEAKQRLHGVLGSLVTLTPEFVEPLLAVTYEDERGLVEGALPERVSAPTMSSDGPDPAEAVARLRPAHRRPGGSP